MLPSVFKALLLVLVGLLAAGARAAEPVSEDKVREDLERQLREMVRSPPPEVVVSFEGLPKDEGYKLLESEFLLDGQPLIVPGPETLTTEGLHRLAVLTVEEGSHTLVSQVTYVNDSWSLFSETSGRLWKMTANVTFQTQRGLRVKVRVVPSVVPNAPDPRLKIKLAHDVTAEMTAKLADATPEPPPDAGPAPEQAAQGPATPDTVAPRPEEVQLASGTAPATPGTARVLVKVTSRKRPVAATLYLRGPGKPRQLSLDWKARKPTRLELAPGTYVVDVIAKGYLAQSRRLVVTKGKAAKLFVSLVRAPTRKLQQVRLKGERVVLPRAPRFAERQSTPRKGTTRGLALLVDMLVRDGAARLRLEGHTDSREGTEASRKQLSEARAKALAAQLVRAGVDPARIETAGFADSRPRAPNLTAPGRQLNRRVEFVLLRK